MYRPLIQKCFGFAEEYFMLNDRLVLHYALWLESLSSRLWEYKPAERREILDMLQEIRCLLNEEHANLSSYGMLMVEYSLREIQRLIRHLNPPVAA